MTNKIEPRTLVVAAHPDDEMLGCGGTLAKLRDRGEAVGVLFVAEGESARFDGAQRGSEPVLKAIESRNRNALNALSSLDIHSSDITFLNLPCCRLDEVPQIEIAKSIENHVLAFKPSRIFCNAARDTNIDHRLVFNAVLTATRPKGQMRCPDLLAFEVLSSTEWNTTSPFRPTLFEDITGYLDAKMAAMACYDDEMRPAPHPRSPEVIAALATYRGAQVGVQAAEGFDLVRSLSL